MTDEVPPWEKWITNHKVHELYAEGIRRYGGTGSRSKDGCIDAALGSAYSAELYSAPEVEGEFVVSGLSFCGYLLFYLATKHCFVDGNKRVAWLTAAQILLEMGLTLDTSTMEAEQFCTGIASGEIRRAEVVVGWIADRLKSIA